MIDTKKIAKLGVLLCLLVIHNDTQAQNLIHSDTQARTLRSPNIQSPAQIYNKNFDKEVSLSTLESTFLLNVLPSFNLKRKYHFVAGKPTWAFDYDKVSRKPMIGVNGHTKNQKTFQKRLFEIKEEPFYASIEARVHFESGDHTLADENQRQLNNVLNVIHQTLQNHKEEHPNEKFITRISIKGYSDAKAFYPGQSEKDRKEKNLALSKRRSQELSEYLSKDLSKLKIRYEVNHEGYGEVLPPNVDDAKVIDDQRRICLIEVEFLALSDAHLPQKLETKNQLAE